jgi:hypothetical protein
MYKFTLIMLVFGVLGVLTTQYSFNKVTSINGPPVELHNIECDGKSHIIYIPNDEYDYEAYTKAYCESLQ